MLGEWEHRLLTELVDKYERTTAFRRGEAPKQRVMVKLYDEKTGATHPWYLVEESQRRQAIHGAVLALADKGLVDYGWVRWEQGNLMSSVWLVWENLTGAYVALERMPKRARLEGICQQLEEAANQCPPGWGRSFLQNCHQSILDTCALGKQLPEGDDQRRELLRCIVFASQPREVELLERVFSLQCLGDSKAFEKGVRGRFLSILRTAFGMEEDATDEAVLAQIGIAKYPEQFEFCGDVSLVTPWGITHFGKLQYGTALFRSELDGGVLQLGSGVTDILTIENRANYIDYIAHHKQPHQVVVYHGGQYSPGKKQFFLQLANQAQWHHWGDIDWGGFSMLARLRREIAPGVMPYRMGLAELVQCQAFCMGFSSEYGEKLEALRQAPLLADCQGVMGYLLEHGCRLEQEALLLV